MRSTGSSITLAAATRRSPRSRWRRPRMSPELWSAAAFATAALVTLAATPLTIKIAERTGFFDLPVGYKGHASPTPYLGGAAIMAGLLAAVLLLRGTGDRHDVLIACALAICLVGTLD